MDLPEQHTKQEDSFQILIKICSGMNKRYLLHQQDPLLIVFKFNQVQENNQVASGKENPH